MYQWEHVEQWFHIVKLKNAESGDGESLQDGWAAIYKSDQMYICQGKKTRKEAREYAAAFMAGIHYLSAKF